MLHNAPIPGFRSSPSINETVISSNEEKKLQCLDKSEANDALISPPEYPFEIVETNEDEFSSPEVYQCCVCDAVLGDFARFNKAIKVSPILGLYLFNDLSSSSIVLSHNYVYNNQQFDQYCMYRNILCKNCKTRVGRFYHSSTQTFEVLINKYVLFTDCFIVYKLGYGHVENVFGGKDKT
jgi:hypothetical protein